MSIRELIGNGDVKTTVVGTGSEALAALQAEHYDCMVLDLGLPDMSGVGLLEEIKKSDAEPPACRSSSTPHGICCRKKQRS